MTATLKMAVFRAVAPRSLAGLAGLSIKIIVALKYSYRILLFPLLTVLCRRNLICLNKQYSSHILKKELK